jgi:hypothetical protein
VTIKKLNETINRGFNISESSLSRIKDHIDNHACGIITTFRSERKYDENKYFNKELIAYLRDKGYGVTVVKGSYIENMGTDSETEVGEESIFVVNLKVDGDDDGELEKELLELGELYHQDAILSIRNGVGILIGTKKDAVKPMPLYHEKIPQGQGRFGRVAGEFLSRIRGREFAFESFRNIGHRLCVHTAAKNVRDKLAAFRNNINESSITNTSSKTYLFKEYRDDTPDYTDDNWSGSEEPLDDSNFARQDSFSLNELERIRINNLKYNKKDFDITLKENGVLVLSWKEFDTDSDVMDMKWFYNEVPLPQTALNAYNKQDKTGLKNIVLDFINTNWTERDVNRFEYDIEDAIDDLEF